MALRTHTILSTFLLAAAVTAGAGHAAELGEAQVRSHLGQALVADVELTLLDDPGRQVAVRVANPDVYRGANIAMPAVLSSLNMTVMRRDGRQFLHLTSLKPVESRHLHIYLELLDGGQRNVRLVTLWLTPDPSPAPPPVPEAPKAQAEPAPLPVPARTPAAVARPAAALQTGEEYVEAAPVRRKAAAKLVAKVAPTKKPVAAPKPVPEAAAQAPSCAPQPSTEHLDACVALGEKNAALRHDLARLEDKVKTLQGAPAKAHSAGTPAAVHQPVPAPAAKEAEKDAPKGAPRIQRKPKKVEPPEPETPWLLIGGAVAGIAALAGLVLALLARRKRAGFGKIPAAHKPARLPKAGKESAVAGEPKPHFVAAVKARLMPNRGKDAAPDAAAAGDEPVLTEVVSRPE
ncbi:FimV/HubP-related protein [Massilia litorea]|uniref:FimV N-terminal domain-containing protein n=1 Tax=Massilia litorea TaxID=2769491 RepID=A0A7L9U5G0_9BURK|nr:hypothetical protein [Massilia litorea]QOL49639.1 hypothetical protein LPB04_22640 [Massilia litorea]